MQSERDEARAMVFDMFHGSCVGYLSKETHDAAKSALIEWGVIRSDQCKGR